MEIKIFQNKLSTKQIPVKRGIILRLIDEMRTTSLDVKARQIGITKWQICFVVFALNLEAKTRILVVQYTNTKTICLKLRMNIALLFALKS